MKTITRRQAEIFEFIKNFIIDNHFPPTVREIGGFFEISAKAAYDHIKALEKKGYISCSNNRSRAIEICSGTEELETIRIPILGNVAAGLPLFAEENNEGSVYLPSSMLKGKKQFALYIEGDSMIGAGIMEGDLGIFSHQAIAENGQIVVAQTENGVTLKRFFKEKNRIRLQSENEAYPPLYTNDIRILGKLITIIRNYD